MSLTTKFVLVLGLREGVAWNENGIRTVTLSQARSYPSSNGRQAFPAKRAAPKRARDLAVVAHCVESDNEIDVLEKITFDRITGCFRIYMIQSCEF